jgi:uncharacterized membrane protein SirB2
MRKPETTYKWAAVLWLFAAGMWTVSGAIGRLAVEQIPLAIASLVAGITFLRAWGRQRLLRRRKQAEFLPVLAETFLLTPGVVLGVAALGAIAATAWLLIKLLSHGS